MKRILLALALIVLPISLFAQSSFTKNLEASFENRAIQYFVEASVDSVGDTLTTATLNLSDGIKNIPVFAKKLFTSTAGTPKLKIIRQENHFGTWRDAKTLYTADSVETLQNFTADTLRAESNRYLIMGVTVNGLSKNRSDTSMKFTLRFERLP